MHDAPAAVGLSDRKLVDRAFARTASLVATALLMAACSGKSPIDPKLGVAASPRIIEEGEPVPKGGGREQVGKPYKVAGKEYLPEQTPEGYSAEGLASWYGSAFHGRMTANGEIFDMGALSAAHPTLPLPSYARVTNVNNGKSIVVRVNDRGPFHGNRALDVSQRVAEVLDFKHRGMARVKIDYVGPASLKGSDDAKLFATLREKGHETNIAVAGLDGTPDALRGAIPAPANYPPAVPPAYPGTTPPVDVAARVETGFSGMTSPQPLTQHGNGSMVEPVLSGFAFNPSALSGLR